MADIEHGLKGRHDRRVDEQTNELQQEPFSMSPAEQRHTPNRVTLLERIREKIGDRKMLKTDCHTPSDRMDFLESATKVEKRWYGRLKLGGFTIQNLTTPR